jgi:uncharacterized protein (DUF1499 family)
MTKPTRRISPREPELAPCPPVHNCVSSRATDAPHRVEPLRFEEAADDAMRRAVTAIGKLPGARIVTTSDTYLRAEVTTPVFRFVDDLELLIDADSQVIHVRSASRAGRWDLGTNRRRVERLRKLFER